MNTEVITKLKIDKPANQVFEAVVSPSEIGNFWFSSSSERWEQGNKVTLRYEEYGAEGVIDVLEVKKDEKIVFSWGEEDEETIVTITLQEADTSTVVEVTESGLKENDPEIVAKMINQKEGWVYTLTCLKAYLENGIDNLRASLIH